MIDGGPGDTGESGADSATDGGRRGLLIRWVAALGTIAALATLVGVRLGDDGTESGAGPQGSAVTVQPTAPPPTGAGMREPPLADEPSTLTKEQLGGIRFLDVTEDAGLDEVQSELPLVAENAMSSAVAVADYDDDGLPDIYVTRLGRRNSLYRNLGDGSFSDVAGAAGVVGPNPEAGSGAAAFADVDADGCLDLYVAGAGAGEAALYLNDCDGHFTDETTDRGVALPVTAAELGAQGHGVTFADYDHDGDLDLLVLHWDPAFMGGEAAAAADEAIADPASTCEKAAEIRRLGGDRFDAAGPNRSRLFNNDGTGHFVDVTASVGLQLDRIAGFTGDFVDVDGDGWEDLLIAGDFCTSALYRNEQGRRFVDITGESGVATDENGMGSVVRDVNDDGRPDWFVTSIALRTTSGDCATRRSNTGCSGNRLYLGEGDGTFVDGTDEYGVRHGWWGWGAAIEDFGNDGRLEFAQTNGYLQSGTSYAAFERDPTRLWVPTGEGNHHEDGAAMAGIDDTGVGHALVAFDYDLDGDLDLLIANFGTTPNLYRNDSPPDRHWLTVQLDDPRRPGNRQGIGARVVVSRDGSAASTTGWISTGGSYESQKLPQLHVGFGTSKAAVRVEVWWPGEPTAQVLDRVAVDQILTVTRESG